MTRIAVCVHVYYLDLAEGLLSYIKNIKRECAIFVTCHEEIYDDVVAIVDHFEFSSVKIVIAPNNGMDVIPFLMLVHEEDLGQYDIVLKLHTKNNKSIDKAEHARIMFEGLCGTSDLCDLIINSFESENAGIVGPALLLRSAQALMYGNRTTVEWIMSLINVHTDEWNFFAGTMFWIAGPALRPLGDAYPTLRDESYAGIVAQTGGDGTLAHSLERVFGALAAANGRQIFVTERRTLERDQFLVMRAEQHPPCRDWRYLTSGSGGMLRRSRDAESHARWLARSDLFNADYYFEISTEFAVPGMDPILHFLLYGDLLSLDPSPDFSVAYYILRNRDVHDHGMPSLVHYLQSGQREGRIGIPTEKDWIKLAVLLGLFDLDFYKREYPDAMILGLDPIEHYEKIGKYMARKLGGGFDPAALPVVRTDTTHRDPLKQYLRLHFRKEAQYYDLLARACSHRDYSAVIRYGPAIVRDFGNSRALLEAEATYYTLTGQWELAESRWDQFWKACSDRNSLGIRQRRSIASFDKPTSSANGKFDLLDVKPRSIHSSYPKVCIYTTLFGDIDELLPISDPVEGIDYICFSDRMRAARGWQVRVLNPDQANSNLNAKVFKILPHRYLPEYEFSLFVDANTLFFGRIRQLIAYCLSEIFVMWQHPLREDVHLEAAAVVGFQRHSPNRIIPQIKAYHSQGLPHDTGLVEGSFIWRRHSDALVVDFMEKWWQEIQTWSSRDQISIGYLMWQEKFRPRIIPDKLGTSRDNIYFSKIPHLDGVARIARGRSDILRLNKVRTPKIAVLYDQRYAQSGSTVMRGNQTSVLLRQALGVEASVAYTYNKVLTEHIILLTKGFLKQTSVEEVMRLSKTNILIGDYVDEPPLDAIVEHLDAIVASSIRAYKNYLHKYPDKPVYHVTHHVDLRLNLNTRSPGRKMRTGYFGEKLNTRITPAIEEHVEFNQVDTSVQSTRWMDSLQEYDLHYAVRQRRGIDGAKPFLKGFTAAHCDANIMVQRNEGDASFYLGHDYPYLLDNDCDEAQIIAMLEQADDDFGGQTWNFGLEIMREVKHRSSWQFVRDELRSMMQTIIRG